MIAGGGKAIKPRGKGEPPLAAEERPKAESIVIHAGTAFGGIERRQNAGAFGGHRQSVESRDLCRTMTAALQRVGRGAKGREEMVKGCGLECRPQ